MRPETEYAARTNGLVEAFDMLSPSEQTRELVNFALFCMPANTNPCELDHVYQETKARIQYDNQFRTAFISEMDTIGHHIARDRRFGRGGLALFQIRGLVDTEYHEAQRLLHEAFPTNAHFASIVTMVRYETRLRQFCVGLKASQIVPLPTAGSIPSKPIPLRMPRR